MISDEELGGVIRSGRERNARMTKSLLAGTGPQTAEQKREKRLRAALDNGEYPSDTAREVFEELLPEWQAYFLDKNAGYGDMADDLGPRAQVVDIHRKSAKLKRGLWDGLDIGHEDPYQVAQDLIGHGFLLLRILRAEMREDEDWKPVSQPRPEPSR